MMNARYGDEHNLLTRYDPAHLRTATQTEAGLTVLMVRHAEARDPGSSAAEVARLADAARGPCHLRRAVRLDHYHHHPGSAGRYRHHPGHQPTGSGDRGVSRIVERPEIKDGAMVARKMMNLSSSFDHCVVIDGHVVAQFVQAIRATSRPRPPSSWSEKRARPRMQVVRASELDTVPLKEAPYAHICCAVAYMKLESGDSF